MRKVVVLAAATVALVSSYRSKSFSFKGVHSPVALLFRSIFSFLMRASGNILRAPSSCSLIEIPEPEVPDEVRSFLGNIGMLNGIPIYYLIPDEQYLTMGSAILNGPLFRPKSCRPFELSTIHPGLS